LKLTDSYDDDHIFNLLNDTDIYSIFKHLFRANCDDRQYGNGVDNDNTLRRVTALSQVELNELMSSLEEQGLVKRSNGTHFLTPSGKAVCHAQVILEKAQSNYDKLKIINSLEKRQNFSRSEFHKIVVTLIDDFHIRDVLHL
jgi:superfamily II helicase